ITEDTLAGSMANTIAGRICNFLDLHGGGYTVDGACSSSLLAIATAANALAGRDLELALAGGVDISLDTFELIGFSKVGALTEKDMTVYDRRGSGFLPGEGCGMVVLKRLEDARADGNYVYAILRGWGVSSDGRGGITAPSVQGQATAIRRAYQRAGYSPRELSFVEGHGTGTAVGDLTELKGIALAMGDGASPRSCGVTSFKSVVGHTKAAAGVGGFIKAVLAVNRRVLPPTAACTEPHPVFDGPAQCLYPIMQGAVHPPTDVLRAGVTGAGFGGINCHITIESADAPAAKLAPAIEERALLVSNQETELFVVAADSAPALAQRVREVAALADGVSLAEMTDLAAKLAGEVRPAAVRAAVVADKPETLTANLKELDRLLTERPPVAGQVMTAQNIWISNAARRTRIGFLFPGQGSQQLNMARVLVERHPWARELATATGSAAIASLIWRPLDRATSQDETAAWLAALTKTEVAQPAICLASLLWMRALAKLGVTPVAVGGHSLGELTAFHAAGAYDEPSLVRLAALRGQAMAAPAEQAGAMASLACSRDQAATLLQRVRGYAVVANINSPRQTVISGDRASVEEAVALAAAENIQARLLPVANAFHSERVSSAADILRNQAPIPRALDQTPLKLFTGTDGSRVEAVPDLPAHFAKQVVAQVNFVELIHSMAAECDLFVEVGPGRVLCGLTAAITGPDGPPCLPVESKPGRDADLNALLATVFVYGGDITWPALHENRLVRPFVPAAQRLFIENPCERPFTAPEMKTSPNAANENLSHDPTLAEALGLPQPALADYLAQRGKFLAAVIRADMQHLPAATTPPITVAPAPAAPKPTSQPPASADAADLILELVAKRTGFPKDSLSLNLRLLDDLNLDSIKSAELVAEAAKRLKLGEQLDPTRFAVTTLRGLSDALRDLLAKSEPAPQPDAAPVRASAAPVRT
ncbi:MAG: type I polyketide synthase, partial [Verrucomicrobia bacterium]|nr:type I polyketide synthase [Verrucomicrobiota bacterium]